MNNGWARATFRKSESRKLSLFSLSAFTLVEVLLVLVLFTAMIGLSLPNLRQFYHVSRFENAVNDFAKRIEYARTLAFLDKTFLRIKVDARENTYRILRLGWSEERQELDYVPLEGKEGRVFRFPKGTRVGIAQGEGDIFIQPDGGVTRLRVTFSESSGSKAELTSQGYFKASVAFLK